RWPRWSGCWRFETGGSRRRSTWTPRTPSATSIMCRTGAARRRSGWRSPMPSGLGDRTAWSPYGRAETSGRGGADVFDGTFLNKIALVTGASRGIGRATALTLAGGGASVAVHYHRNEAMAEEVARTIRDQGRRARAIGANLESPEEITRLFD